MTEKSNPGVAAAIETETMTTTDPTNNLICTLTTQTLHMWDWKDSRLTPRQGAALAQTLSLWIDQDLDDMLSKNPTYNTPWHEDGPFAHIDDTALITIGAGMKPFIRQTQRVCRAHLERLDNGEMPLSHPEFVSHVPQRPGDQEWDELIDEFDALIADRPAIKAVSHGTPTQVVEAIREHPAYTWFAPSV